jgi:hypothetical protein
MTDPNFDPFDRTRPIDNVATTERLEMPRAQPSAAGDSARAAAEPDRGAPGRADPPGEPNRPRPKPATAP